MIQDARVKRAQGDVTDANTLDNEAGSMIQSVLAAVPAAQQEATRDSTIRTITTVALIPVVVALSTLIFYATFRTWRYYEKMKLYEMRIVEKKTED
jgi:heme/copper-type cytochrome/quinol oxidase subunit 2